MKNICNKLNRLWRIFATGLAFTFFGMGGLIFSLFYFPLIGLLFKSDSKKNQIVRSSVSLGFKVFMYFMHYIGVLYFHKKKIEILQSEKSCILIANHPTLIDVIAIIAYCPNACCIVKKEIWQNFFLKGVVQIAGYVPNIEHTDLLEQCEKSVKNGDVLIIFPEGTRTKPGQPPVFQRGAAHIALSLNCPVRCVEIQCYPLTLTKGLPWYQVPERRTDFTIEIKDRIDPRQCITEGTSRPLAARKMTRLFLNQCFGSESEMKRKVYGERFNLEINDQKWAQIDEKGSLFLMKLTSWGYTALGDRFSRYILNFICFYYYLFAVNAKRSSRQFVKIYQAYCQEKGITPRALTSYQHISSFAHMVLDKLAIWKGSITQKDFYPGDIAALQSIYNANKGALFISSHYGNVEIARAQGRTHSKITYNALIYNKNSKKIFTILKHFSPDIEKSIIPVDELGPRVGTVLLDKIKNGEWLFFTGDRITAGSDKTMSAELLGEAIQLPQGPFLISYLLKTPVYSFHCYNSAQGYRIQFREITPQIQSSRKNRTKYVEELAANYLQDLEALIIEDPSQWFNFYNYWKEYEY